MLDKPIFSALCYNFSATKIRAPWRGCLWLLKTLSLVLSYSISFKNSIKTENHRLSSDRFTRRIALTPAPIKPGLRRNVRFKAVAGKDLYLEDGKTRCDTADIGI